MRYENFDLNKMYKFDITVYPSDKTKYRFQKDEVSHDISGLLFADNYRDALEKLYTQLTAEYGKTICQPNVRHFVSEVIPCMNEDNFYCTGFSTHSCIENTVKENVSKFENHPKCTTCKIKRTDGYCSVLSRYVRNTEYCNYHTEIK